MSAAWKQLERHTAKALGGKRNPAAAGAGGCDVLEVPGFVVECKYRQTLQIDTLFREERAKRKKELSDGNRFALVVRAKGREPLAVLSLADFAALLSTVN